MPLTHRQAKILQANLNPRRVSKTHDGATHLEAWDVRAHLNRVFGFCNWSEQLTDLTMLYEENTAKDGQPARWRAAYRATIRLEVRDEHGAPLADYTEAAAGGTMGTMPDTKRDEAHDMGIKTAESQALKRCATNLGTQFGLSLYSDGTLQDVVGGTLVGPNAMPEPPETPHLDPRNVTPT